MTEILLVSAIAIILILAGIAGTLHWRLYKLRRQQEEERLAMERKRREQRERINNSIQIIAQALAAEQVGATEASIRISVLMDALEVEPAVKEEFTAFYRLADEASHIPILDAWKALSRPERAAFDKELVALEEKYADFVIDAAQRIRGRQL